MCSQFSWSTWSHWLLHHNFQVIFDLSLPFFDLITLRACNHELPYEISGKSRLKELILRNSIFYNFRESIPASPLFSNILRIDITNASIFLSRTSFERMSIMDHILKQKKDNKKCKIKDIVTDQTPTYKYKHLGVNISRGAVTNLSKYPESYLPEDINIPHEPLEISCVSKLRNHFRYSLFIIICLHWLLLDHWFVLQIQKIWPSQVHVCLLPGGQSIIVNLYLQNQTALKLLSDIDFS